MNKRPLLMSGLSLVAMIGFAVLIVSGQSRTAQDFVLGEKPAQIPVEADEVLDRLATFAEGGLSSEEAQRRYERYGPNELEEAPPTSFWQMLFEQFNNFVVILLIVAAVISAALGEFIY